MNYEWNEMNNRNQRRIRNSSFIAIFRLAFFLGFFYFLLQMQNYPHRHQILTIESSTLFI